MQNYIKAIAGAGLLAATVSVNAATVKEVDSAYCEPIYNEATDTLYVPRCYRLAQEPPPPNMAERLLGRTIKGVQNTFENQLGNGIDRQIYDMGEEMRDVLGTDK
jgi:hypothetical protein